MTEDLAVDPPPEKKKRKKAASPTAMTLKECRKRGWVAQVVERFNSYTKQRIDLFGVIDIVVITDVGILGIQACIGGDHSTRRKKITAETRARAWVRAGAGLEVWSWAKRGERGVRKLWTLRAEVITADMFSLPVHEASAA